MSPSITRLLGYSVEEAMAKPMDAIYTAASFETVMNVRAEELAIVKTEQKDQPRSQTLELELYRKDGSIVPVEATFSLIREPDGRAAQILVIARNITERKEAAEKLQLQYEHERDLRLQLEEEIRKRIEFTRALVHELKTPITPVLAAVELLLEEIKDKRLTKLVQSIDRSALNLNRRIDELLDLARGEIDMLQLELQTIEPLPLLKDIGNEFTSLAQQNGQSLSFDLPAHLPSVLADSERLRQVVYNLLNNALKFTPAGGKVTLQAREVDADLVVEVKDTGPGISEEDQKRMFEAYYRRIGDRERLSGLGLGLALAKRLVELHGGRIWVNSRLGEGSTFGFSLPLVAVSPDEGQDNLEEKS